MAKRSAKEWQQIALLAGGTIAVFLVGRKLLQFLNVIQTPEQKSIQQAQQRTLQQAQQQLRVSPTKPDFFWQNSANIIYEAWKYSALSDNKTLAESKLKEVMNDADYLKLVQYYGKRRNYFFGIPTGDLMTLSEAANSELSTSAINRINANYAQKRIKFKI